MNCPTCQTVLVQVKDIYCGWFWHCTMCKVDHGQVQYVNGNPVVPVHFEREVRRG